MSKIDFGKILLDRFRENTHRTPSAIPSASRAVSIPEDLPNDEDTTAPRAAMPTWRRFQEMYDDYYSKHGKPFIPPKVKPIGDLDLNQVTAIGDLPLPDPKLREFKPGLNPGLRL